MTIETIDQQIKDQLTGTRRFLVTFPANKAMADAWALPYVDDDEDEGGFAVMQIQLSDNKIGISFSGDGRKLTDSDCTELMGAIRHQEQEYLWRRYSVAMGLHETLTNTDPLFIEADLVGPIPATPDKFIKKYYYYS